ncbi:SRPBCC family protein [Nocardioides sambongensis]|uniref:SRPBCC family protein n=1 Tax=Nocardioides sambongensis TaxID=2589074 RepID=UPI0018C8B6A5|nr:SRPBCC family protein [Nocardioides sambongensis]
MGAAAPGGGRVRTGGDPLTRQVVLDAAVDAGTLFAFLADPARRPSWQSSLRRVADVVPGQGGVLGAGTTWTDVTVVPGIRPRMRTTVADPGVRWAEEGRCGPVRAALTLDFLPRAGGCRVEAVFEVSGAGVGPFLTAIAGRPIAADLRRAVELAGG